MRANRVLLCGVGLVLGVCVAAMLGQATDRDAGWMIVLPVLFGSAWIGAAFGAVIGLAFDA